MDMEQIKNMNKEEAIQVVKDIISDKALSPTEIGPFVFESTYTCTRNERERAIHTAKKMWDWIRDNMGDTDAESWLQDNIDPEDYEACGIKLHLYSIYTIDFHKEVTVCVPNTYDEDKVYDFVTDELPFDMGDLDYEVLEDACDILIQDVENKYRCIDNEPRDFEYEDWDV